MDKVIEDKRWIKPKHWKFIIIGAFIVASIFLFLFRDPVSTYRVEKDKVSIETVASGEFNDYISVTGQVVPISTIFLDAIEGGRVEKLIIEEGEMLHKGDVILELANNNLNLEILNSEAQLAEKSNFLREVRISMEQQKLDIEKSLLQTTFDLKTKKRTYDQNKELYEEGLISKEEFLLSEENFLLAQKSRDMMFERKNQDSMFRKIQISQLRANLDNMQKNLELVNQRLENLKVRAPVDGQLGVLDAEIGQSNGMGQR
jgi:HlyD family secretion protein